MALTWTSEQVLQLAPDSASAKAGQDLARNVRKWNNMGQDERAVWGECQGSGKLPYQTQIDLSGPAFRCSCPSHKFPCKHGIGLFLIFVSKTELFKAEPLPDWVKKWLEGRDSKAQDRAKKEERGGEVADPAAQAKRAAERLNKINAGVQDLRLWLRDLIRQGLGIAEVHSYKFWDTPAARMVDAQAPGLARLLREMSGVASSGANWQERLLERLSKLHLLLEGWQRLETLEPETQADIRMLVGLSQSQDELLKNTGVKDQWLVLAQTVEEEEKLKVQRTWLWGKENNRAALLLQFSASNQPFALKLAPSTCVEAELIYYPGTYPLRAIIKQQNLADTIPTNLPGYHNIEAAITAYTSALARNPWLEEFPLGLEEAFVVRQEERWLIADANGKFLPLPTNYTQVWRLLALSGGYPLNIFGEWNGSYYKPLSVINRERIMSL